MQGQAEEVIVQEQNISEVNEKEEQHIENLEQPERTEMPPVEDERKAVENEKEQLFKDEMKCREFFVMLPDIMDQQLAFWFNNIELLKGA
ncbi:DUF3964 domain-containing protein [Bacillus nitratireducens]|nr:DUF3964 domain-containing protein [Bacillus nitratireducens]